MKTKIIVGAAFAGVALLVSGCGKAVQVPPAHVGKILDASGYQKDIKQPSTFRLPYVMWGADPRLVLVELSEEAVEEKFVIFMPKDELNLTLESRGNFAISEKPEHVDWLFDKVAPSDQAGNYMIDFEKVYKVYGENVVRTVIRDIVTKHTIEEVLKNREVISAEIQAEVVKGFEKLPIRVRSINLAHVAPPEIVVKAQEAKKEREIQIERSEADKNIRLKQAEADLQVAQKKQAAELVEAETQVLVEQKLSSAVSAAWINQRSLSVLEKIAEKGNQVFLLPYDVFQNPSLMVGLNQEALRTLRTQSAGKIAVPTTDGKEVK